jgi:hypothetical protein
VELKHCKKCDTHKPLTEFNNRKSSTDGLQYQCRQCEKNNHDAHYKKSKGEYVRRAMKNTKRYVEEYQQWKLTQVCSICSEEDPVCIDFHHLDPKQKDINISNIGLRNGLRAVQQELKKCIPVCANCHRKIHKYGLEYVKSLYAPVAER